MAKGKGNAGAVANRPAYSRVSFLYQAAALLAIGSGSTAEQGPARRQGSSRTREEGPARIGEPGSGPGPAEPADPVPDPVPDPDSKKSKEPTPEHVRPTGTPAAVAPEALQAMSRHLLTHMRSVARKTNMRLRPAVKRSVCKYCDTLLVEGDTCVSTVENKSRGGAKPWADVLVMRCQTCGRTRRYPVAASRQPRRPFRSKTMGIRPKSQVQTQAQAQPQQTVQQEPLHISKAAG